jgi:hypothetical protein
MDAQRWGGTGDHLGGRHGVPLLYIVPPGHSVSRQIEGTAGDLTVLSYSHPDELRDGVRTWIREHRHMIEAGPSRRLGREVRLDVLHQRLSQVWAGTSESGQSRVAAHLGISPDLIAWWLPGVDFLAAAPVSHVLMLSTELVGSTAAVLGRQELTLDQIEAVLTASAEQGWARETAERIRRRGEAELALGGVRRFRLDTPEDWTRLQEALDP